MMTEFARHVCYFMDCYPLHHYRRLERGQQKLSVLLLGSGAKLNILLQKILTGGQLLDTELDVTVVSNRAVHIGRALLDRAPELGTFVRVIYGVEKITNPENPYAVLQFENIPLKAEYIEHILEERSENTYILISSGDDTKNAELATACANYAFEQNVLVGYVQGKQPEQVPESSKATIVPFGFPLENRRQYRRQLEQIALNLHYSYAKSQDERKSVEKIVQEFENEYILISNLETAVHLRSKLASCGIELDNPQAAAEELFQKISEDSLLVEQLAALEHRRWVLEKALQGYHQVENLDLLYSAPGVTTHDSKAKWHCCLLPCAQNGESRLLPTDWNSRKPEQRTDRDPLDIMSLMIHQKCGELANKNERIIYQIFQNMRECFSEEVLSYEKLEQLHWLEQIVSLLYQQKKSAIPLFQTEWDSLWEVIHQQSVSRCYQMEQQLEMLKTAVAPLLEYISCKDYKEMDRLLVRQIPFALTFRMKSTLVKLMSERSIVNVLSALYLEPHSFIFIAVTESVDELQKYKLQAENIESFLKKRNLIPTVEYHILATKQVIEMSEQKWHDNSWNCIFHVVERKNIDEIYKTITNLINLIEPDYIDVTDSEPSLIWAVAQYAKERNIPCIYEKNGKLLQLTHAPEVGYNTLYKSMTVAELFALNGTALQASESQRLSDLTGCYKK